jgi:hypothetical protein
VAEAYDRGLKIWLCSIECACVRSSLRVAHVRGSVPHSRRAIPRSRPDDALLKLGPEEDDFRLCISGLLGELVENRAMSVLSRGNQPSSGVVRLPTIEASLIRGHGAKLLAKPLGCLHHADAAVPVGLDSAATPADVSSWSSSGPASRARSSFSDGCRLTGAWTRVPAPCSHVLLYYEATRQQSSAKGSASVATRARCCLSMSALSRSKQC